MSKSLVTRLFVGGLVAVVAGIAFGFAVIVFAYGSNAFLMSGPDVTGVQPTPFAWSLIGAIVLAGVTVLGGMVAGLVAWIGALLNTAQLDDKTWFIVLLVLGLLSFGFFAMLAYVIAGPDGTEARTSRPAQLPA